MPGHMSPFGLGARGGPEGWAEGYWREAERQLYPMVLADPDEYRQAVMLVRRTADRLGRHASRGELVGAFRDDPFLAEQVAASSGLGSDDLDIAMVTGAGFALRRRELYRAGQYGSGVDRRSHRGETR